MEFSGVNIVSYIWAIVSFFTSFNIVSALYPLYTVLLNLHDGMTKVVLTIGVFLTVFATMFLVPYNIAINRKEES